MKVREILLITVLALAGAWALSSPVREIQHMALGPTEIGGRLSIFDRGCRYTWNTGLYTLANCAANGSTSTTVAPGNYLMTVSTEQVVVCDTSGSCSAGGTPLVIGTQLQVTYDVATYIACRSTGATGNIAFTPCLAK